jgi:glycosyltransferase involved in cell wall biosynthesis
MEVGAGLARMAVVAIDVRHWRDFGYGTYIRNLVRTLAKVESEFDFRLIAKPEHMAELAGLPGRFQAIAYERADKERLDNIAFPWFLRTLRPDLVHIPLNTVPWFLPRPYVVTIHDLSTLVFGFGNEARDRMHRMRFRRGLVRADRVIAVSESTRRDVHNLLNIPAARVRRIYNAIDGDFPTLAANADVQGTLDRYQIHYPFLLYAGSVRPQKNVARIIEAFAVLREDLEHHPRYKDLRLVIIGDEMSKYPNIRRAVLQGRVEKQVRFLGFVPSEALHAFYRSAEVFVFPSLYEGFGLPPLEAMASGTPVVTSGVSSLPEVVGDAAMIVKPENVFDIARGIKEVLLNETLRCSLVERGFDQVRRFSWYETAAQVLETYREVLAARR